jgi:hypothetical protein
MNIQNPILIENVLNQIDYDNLISSIPDPKSLEYQNGFSRYIASEKSLPILKEISIKLVPIARKIFKSENLLPTYSLFAHYEGPDASLYRHKDDNACTYTLDLCVYQKEIWPLFVEGVPYSLKPNQALAYYGNDQEHWREDFPNPSNNNVAMVFFHFAEPDHWYFVEGPEYLETHIRKKK